jgi:hypothetical protein
VHKLRATSTSQGTNRWSVESISRVDAIAQDGADLLSGLPKISRHGLPFPLHDARKAPLRIAGEGAAHQFFGPNNATDVWSVKKVSPQSMIHLTEKPVELAVGASYVARQSEITWPLTSVRRSSLPLCL